MSIMIDAMVMGNSLKEHGSKAKRYLCINDDTLASKISCLMEAFWNVVPVSHVEISRLHPGVSDELLKHLQGVCSKIQTMGAAKNAAAGRANALW